MIGIIVQVDRNIATRRRGQGRRVGVGGRAQFVHLYAVTSIKNQFAGQGGRVGQLDLHGVVLGVLDGGETRVQGR